MSGYACRRRSSVRAMSLLFGAGVFACEEDSPQTDGVVDSSGGGLVRGLPDVTEVEVVDAAPDADDAMSGTDSEMECGPSAVCPEGRPEGFTIDGRFTGWPEDPDCLEWPMCPLEGVYTDLYAAFYGDRLAVLDDWHVKDEAPIDDSQCNLFYLYSVGNGSMYEIRVYGDQRIEVRRNGGLYEPDELQGASSFGASPRRTEPHTMYEFAIQLAGAAAAPLVMSECDPPPDPPRDLSSSTAFADRCSPSPPLCSSRRPTQRQVSRAA